MKRGPCAGAILGLIVASSFVAGPSRPARGDEDLTPYINRYKDARSNGRYREAEAAARSVLVLANRGGDWLVTARWSQALAEVLLDQADWAQAEKFFKSSLDAWTHVRQPDESEVAWALQGLAIAYRRQARFDEAEPLLKRVIAIRERTQGPDHVDVAVTLNSLANIYRDQYRYTDAEPLFLRAIAILEKERPVSPMELTSSLNNLGELYIDVGRLTEAQRLIERALGIREKTLGPEHPYVATSLGDLARLYSIQGRYADAEPLIKRGNDISEKVFGPDNQDAGIGASQLADLYLEQRRYAEAEVLFKRALAIHERNLGPESTYVADNLDRLGILNADQRRFDTAALFFQRALSIREKTLGPEHPKVARSLTLLGNLNRVRGSYDAAVPLLTKAMAMRERALGPDAPWNASLAWALARAERDRGRLEDAERWVNRALSIGDQAGYSPGELSDQHALHADLAWRAGRRAEAVAELRSALAFANEQRGHASGAERERAGLFEEYVAFYERMVEWQAELGDVGAAFAAMEQSRARALLDEMATAGANLQAKRAPDELARLEQRGAAIYERIARLERQLEAVGRGPARNKDAQKLRAELAQARQQLYEQERDIRASSPVYRELLNRGAKPRSLDEVRGRVCGDGALLLEYLIGEEGSYVIAARSESARLYKLDVREDAAKTLGVEPGPLTALRLRTTLTGKEGAGILPRLANESAAVPVDELASLWKTLVPEDVRGELTGGGVKRLVIVPDGPLALLPFETLVVDPDAGPQYLLDAGPPIVYAPSSTVLIGLADRARPAARSDREPVLAVGDPAYPRPGQSPAAAPLVETARTRYAVAGGALPPLPYTAWEVQSVAKVFDDAGVKAVTLTGPTATEAGVRFWAPRRRILHLACHGLADDSLGNFYAALALTPGPKASGPANDGFLELAEIAALDLRGCDLAILSACQTNFGPQQIGEGTWALSREFLVAGAKRVIASNWVVNDEAGANLVSNYCTLLARDEKAGKPIDYARSLQEAKRWLRTRENNKWKAPFYWSTLVLVGPP